MAQGYTGYNIIENSITLKDSANLDAFSRLRISNPLNIFNNQFTYDLSPYVFEKYTDDAVNNFVTHDTTNRLASINTTLGTAIGSYIYMQSYEYIPYQPGRSQLVFITFNMFPAGSATPGSSYKRVGLVDDNNGFEFLYDPTALELAFSIKSTTTPGIQIVVKSSWNIDKLDGTGPSGITLDITKVQILVIDFQALYVGRVRMGFDIDGEIIYAHEFNHANIFDFPYIATANLPVRVGIENYVLSGGPDVMDFICCSVTSEGGVDDINKFAYNFVYTNSKLTLPTASTYICSLSPATTFNGITNRTKFVIDSIEFLNTGTKAFKWSLGIGSTLAGAAYTAINAASATQSDTAATATALGLVIDTGYVGGGTGATNPLSIDSISSKYPITLNAAGAKRPNGTLSLFAEAIGGATDFYYVIKWKEIR